MSDDIVKSFGFKENVAYQCIYLKVSGSKFIILLLHVDDIFFFSNDIGLVHDTKEILTKTFEMKDLGEMFFLLGIESHKNRSRGMLEFSQKATLNVSLKS